MLAFIFDIDGTWSIPMSSTSIPGTAHSVRFGKQFPREKLRAQIGKGSDQYLPEFLTPDEIDRFGKELDDYRSDLFKKEYLPKVQDHSRKYVNFFSESVTTTNASSSPPPVKRLTRNITSTFLRSTISSKGTPPATMPTNLNRRPTSLPLH